MNWFREIFENFLKGFKQYDNFSGSATRKEFWHFFLINIFVSMFFIMLDLMFFSKTVGEIGFLSLIYSFISFVPNVSISVRRLHDMGYSGWFVFLSFIPLINIVVFLVMIFKEGDVELPQPNDYKK